MAKNEREKLRKELEEYFRNWKRYGMNETKAEKFVEESMELLSKFQEIPSQEDRDMAVRKLLKKYGIVEENKEQSGGNC